MSRQIIDPEEFRNEGFLQEVNRQFFHPLGLAMAVFTDYGLDEDGCMAVQIYDERDDPEGWFFGEGELSQEKADNVAALRVSKIQLRNEILQRTGLGRSPVQEINEIPK